MKEADVERQEKKFIEFRLPTKKDLALAKKLIQEIGDLTTVNFILAPSFPSELNPLVPDYQTAVREIIRSAGLEKHGFEWQKWYSPAREEGDDHSAKFLSGVVIGRDVLNQRIFRGKLEESPDAPHIKSLLLEPIHQAYQWYDVAYWNLGSFKKLLSAAVRPTGYLILVKAGVLLFSDEVQKLQKGEIVTPKYWGGLNSWEIVEDQLDTYAVQDSQLYRVWAHLLD